MGGLYTNNVKVVIALKFVEFTKEKHIDELILLFCDNFDAYCWEEGLTIFATIVGVIFVLFCANIMLSGNPEN
jgi:hypothetical protein